MGYLLPGKLISFAGRDVKVQAEEDGQVLNAVAFNNLIASQMTFLTQSCQDLDR